MKINKRVAGLVAAVGFSAAALTLAPATDAAPKSVQSTASAAEVAFVYNVGWSTSPIKVFSRPNGKGTWQVIKPGGHSYFTRVGFPDSFEVGPGCQVDLDGTFRLGHMSVFVGKGHRKVIKNFPATMFEQRVAVESHCGLNGPIR